jgi:ribonuclease J
MADSTLRVLPLGGLGEIGKNMTVFELEERIVVVDVGLRFPTAEMVGIDLVLPDFTYLRSRIDDIEGIVVTHGHEDHLGSLPWVLRELAVDIPVYGGPLTTAMARSKLDEHRLREVDVNDVRDGERIELGPFEIELVHMTHSIPDSCAVALHTEMGTVLVTGDYKFDQTPVDGKPADVGRLAELGSEELLLLCGDSTNADRPGFSPSEAIVGPKLQELFLGAPGRIVVTCFASNIHRVQQVVDAAAAHGRKVSLVGRSMRKNVNIGRSLGHIELPEGILVQPRELDDWADEKLVIVITTRDAPIHASGHGYQEEIKLLLNLVKPRYVMPFHGDFKRIHLHAQLAEAVGIDPESIFKGENGLPLELDGRGARFASPERSGMIFVDGVDIGDPTDVALRDRRMLSADGIFVVVATISEQDGSSVADPEVIFRGVPYPDDAAELLDELRSTVEASLARAASEEIREIDLLQQVLHDDLAEFVYERLRRRPMVLPVVVEV